MTKVIAKNNTRFWQNRWGYLLVALLALTIAYAIASRAIDTGSLQQYGLTIVFLIIGLNRLYKLVRG